MQLGARRDGGILTAQFRLAFNWSGTIQDLDTARVLDSRDITPCPVDVVSSWVERAGAGIVAPTVRGVSAQSTPLSATTVRRNTAIGVVRAASIQRCHEYLATLTDVDRDNNFFFGSLSTILGGLGAIFTPTATVRALSGAAGIASGVRAEMNTTFFYNQAIGAIRKAIEKRMSDRWDALSTRLVIEDIDHLPYALAYAEMEAIHGQCAIGAAFAEITEALTRPGPTQPLTYEQRLQVRIRERELERRVQALGGRLPQRPAGEN